MNFRIQALVQSLQVPKTAPHRNVVYSISIGHSHRVWHGVPSSSMHFPLVASFITPVLNQRFFKIAVP